MAKLTKAAVIAAQEDVIKGVGGLTTVPNTKLKAAEYYPEFWQSMLDIGLDDEDRKGFEPATNEVLDALAAKYPDMVETPDEEEEKPTKHKKEKKSKKEEPVVEEKPAKKAKAPKKGKAKKGSFDPIALAESLKENKKINRAEMYALVDEHADFFGDNVDTLKGITNPMVLKKQMRNALEGEAVVVKPMKKREKKEKVVEVVPTLSETVEAAEDLDALKAIAKANKEAFPGVKAKKFDKVKKLRKAMLAVVVEPEVKATKKRAASGMSREESAKARQERIDFIEKTLDKNKGIMLRKDLTEAALAKFPEPAKMVKDLISYGTNPKYNKFKELLINDKEAGTIGYESATKPTKKGKKAKAPVVEAPKPTKEKKEKKSKKDKKKGKKSKK